MNSASNFSGFVCFVAAGYLVRVTDSHRAPVTMVAASLIMAAVLFSRLDGSAKIFWDGAGVAKPLAC